MNGKFHKKCVAISPKRSMEKTLKTVQFAI